jgi:hypothetical protein
MISSLTFIQCTKVDGKSVAIRLADIAAIEEPSDALVELNGASCRIVLSASQWSYDIKEPYETVRSDLDAWLKAQR